ncbi:MAG: DUF2281 domain-containing protein [Methylococcaceae bacterium]|nr:DUF2281 domain-containing protein [Methylococcaceae bacterium]
MSAVIENKIIERLHSLEEPKLLEVLDFVEFLAQRRANPRPSEPDQKARGAMKGRLSSTDEFIARKTDEPAPPPRRSAPSFHSITSPKNFAVASKAGHPIYRPIPNIWKALVNDTDHPG